MWPCYLSQSHDVCVLFLWFPSGEDSPFYYRMLKIFLICTSCVTNSVHIGSSRSGDHAAFRRSDEAWIIITLTCLCQFSDTSLYVISLHIGRSLIKLGNIVLTVLFVTRSCSYKNKAGMVVILTGIHGFRVALFAFAHSECF